MFVQNKRLSFQNGSMRTIPVANPNRKIAAKSSMQTSNFLGGIFGANAGNTGINTQVQGGMNPSGMLRGLIAENEDSLRAYYRDIYFHDPVCGASADILSTFPFGNFNLYGVKEDRLAKYEESLARINTKSLLPEISLARLVDGAFVGSLVYNKVDKVVMDILFYSLGDCKVVSNPFYSSDPEITVKNTQELRNFISSDSASSRAFLSKLPEELRKALSASAFKLDTLTTLFVPRKTLPGVPYTSWFKRVLPIYLLEKTLYRGTIVESNKRQRSMLHVTMGDDTHEFTPEEMAETVNQFQLADLDPLGAVIGTRNNVTASELRQGGDFWKWTDNIDILTPYKLRALGFSEALLSQDGTYSNVETAYNVFLETCDMSRSELVYETFTNKIFPLIALSNGFYKDVNKNASSRKELTYEANDYSNLDIPEIRFEKDLSARREDNLVDMLEKLEEKGFPVALRTYAAAGKVSLSKLMDDARNEKSDRLKIEELLGKEKGEEIASLTPTNLLDRKFPESMSELSSVTKTGKKKWVVNQESANKKINALIIKVAKTDWAKNV